LNDTSPAKFERSQSVVKFGVKGLNDDSVLLSEILVKRHDK